jgi:hypothetical protein
MATGDAYTPMQGTKYEFDIAHVLDEKTALTMRLTCVYGCFSDENALTTCTITTDFPPPFAIAAAAAP